MNDPERFLREGSRILYDWLTRPIFTVGEAIFSASSLLKLLVFVLLLFWLARLLRRFLARQLFPRLSLETGVAHALSTLSSYTLIILGLIVAFQAAGINLTSLTVLFGAIGVGIGFGLQSLAANFISGLIVLIERPIQVGDRIQVGDLNGRVTAIKFRATEILTNDLIAVVVPNSEITSQQVINWSRGGDRIRIKVPIGVAYGSDIGRVRQALLEAADRTDAVLKSPPPKVRLTGFGDSSIDFELLGWTRELLHRRGEFISRVNFAIHEALARHGIEIPFPQRDLHLRSPIPLPIGQGTRSPDAGAAPRQTRTGSQPGQAPG
ncbi:MAG: mechanosensitive ion channel [Acidobacteria bacterium]|nr:mechanosensitive ion channel [Acidobacteriota bacterium]